MTTQLHCEDCHALLQPEERDDVTYEIPGSDAPHIYCHTCAPNAGFCPGCHQFYGGTDFDEHFLHAKGICKDCWDSLLDEPDLFDDDTQPDFFY